MMKKEAQETAESVKRGIDFEAASKLILDSQWLRNVYPLLGFTSLPTFYSLGDNIIMDSSIVVA